MSSGSFGENSNASTEVGIEIPPLHDSQQGYHKLASMMGLFPDVAIFKRFSTLNVKNILYLQAELAHLENDLDLAAQEDALSGDVFRIDFYRSWCTLSNAESLPNGNGQQWKIFLKIREVLQQYSE